MMRLISLAMLCLSLSGCVFTEKMLIPSRYIQTDVFGIGTTAEQIEDDYTVEYTVERQVGNHFIVRKVQTDSKGTKTERVKAYFAEVDEFLIFAIEQDSIYEGRAKGWTYGIFGTKPNGNFGYALPHPYNLAKLAHRQPPSPEDKGNPFDFSNRGTAITGRNPDSAARILSRHRAWLQTNTIASIQATSWQQVYDLLRAAAYSGYVTSYEFDRVDLR